MVEEATSFSWGFPFLEVMKYQFYTVELHKKNWRDYIKQDNPIAAALLSKMGYTKEERVQVKKEFLRMLVRLELDPARMHLITGFFDAYLVLNYIEEGKLREEIQMLESKEEKKIMELKTNWEKTAELKGKIEGERRILSKFIKAQFGEVSNGMLEQVAGLANLELLDRLTDQLFQISNFEEAVKLVNEAYEEQQARHQM